MSAMVTFFLMMALHPDTQQRAQDEIDRVPVGKSHLPTIEDQEALPFTMAVMKEVLRLAPVAPMGTEPFSSIIHFFNNIQP
jgi:cytochrome P450